MAFPISPTNNQTAQVNGITYIYNSADNAWSRLTAPFGNLSVNGDLVVAGNITGLYGTFISNLSIGPGSTQQDVLDLNNNNLYGVNTIRIYDPGTSEGIVWEGGSGWSIYESPNDLSNATGNLQIVLGSTRVFTVDTNETVNIPSTWEATSTTTGALTVGGGVGVAGNLWVGGNIIIAGNTYVVNSTIENQVTGNLLVGSPITFPAINANIQYGGNQDSYLQLLVQNANSGASASTDFVAAADNAGSDADTYIDMGINSSTYNQAGYTASYPNDGYLYVQGNTTTGGGNLILATMTNRDIVFTTGGQNTNNEVMRITSGNVVQVTNNQASTSTTTGALVVSGGVGISGALYLPAIGDVSANISAFYTYANTKLGTNNNGNLVIDATTTSTSATTGALVVAGGIGVAGNVVADKFYTTNGLYWAGNGVAFSSGGGGSGTPAGSNQQIQYNNGGVFGASSGLVYDGVSLKVNGNLESTYHNGDEGGEIFLQKPDTNTTLASGITIDVFQNKLRFFENGGTNRGFYLDITSGGTTVGTNIMSGGGGGGSPAGSTGDVQFNNGGALGATSLFYDSATGNLVLTDTTTSTSTTTGAFVVKGGVGVAGNVVADKFYTTNGLYWSGNGVAFSSGGGSGLTYTSDTSPHVSPAIGDQWYDTSTDILYEYIEDGTSSYWIDVQSPIFNGSLSTNLVGNLSITGNLAVAKAISATGNITTVANLNVLRSANIYGNILGGNIFVNRNATVVSNLTVSGYTILANIISSGNITNSGNITTTDDLSANNITVTNNISTLTITTGNIAAGNLSVSGNVTTGLTVEGTINAGNLLTTGSLSGNATTTGSLTSTGNVLFTGANINLGSAANLHITGGSDGFYLQTDGTGNVSWQSLPLTSIQEFTATGGQTVFTIVGTYTVGTVLVFVNGIQMNSVDYTATDGTTIVLTDARIAGDTVRIISSVGASSLSSGLVLSVTNTKNFAVAMSIAMGM